MFEWVLIAFCAFWIDLYNLVSISYRYGRHIFGIDAATKPPRHFQRKEKGNKVGFTLAEPFFIRVLDTYGRCIFGADVAAKPPHHF